MNTAFSKEPAQPPRRSALLSVRLDIEWVVLRDEVPGLFKKSIAGIVDDCVIVKLMTKLIEYTLKEHKGHIVDHLFIRHTHVRSD